MSIRAEDIDLVPFVRRLVTNHLRSEDMYIAEALQDIDPGDEEMSDTEYERLVEKAQELVAADLERLLTIYEKENNR